MFSAIEGSENNSLAVYIIKTTLLRACFVIKQITENILAIIKKRIKSNGHGVLLSNSVSMSLRAAVFESDIPLPFHIRRFNLIIKLQIKWTKVCQP